MKPPIDVGDEPMGVAVNVATKQGFVVNSNDNSVSVIDLSTDSVTRTLTTSDGVGLGPIDIAVDNDPFVAVIGNEDSFSVSLIDLN